MFFTVFSVQHVYVVLLVAKVTDEPSVVDTELSVDGIIFVFKWIFLLLGFLRDVSRYSCCLFNNKIALLRGPLTTLLNVARSYHAECTVLLHKLHGFINFCYNLRHFHFPLLSSAFLNISVLDVSCVDLLFDRSSLPLCEHNACWSTIRVFL